MLLAAPAKVSNYKMPRYLPSSARERDLSKEEQLEKQAVVVCRVKECF